MTRLKIYIILLIAQSMYVTSVYSMLKNSTIQDVAVTWDCDIPTVWKRARRVISDEIDKRFARKWYDFRKPSLETSLKIIKVPEKLFPYLAPLFNDNFFSNLRNQNNNFDDACSVIIDHYQNFIETSLNGLNIDTLYDDLRSNLSQETFNYLRASIEEEFWKVNKYLLITKHTAAINNIAFNYETKRIASACDDTTTQIWNLKTGTREHVLPHDDAVNTVSFCHDGSRLATATKSSCIIRIWNTTTGQLLHILSRGLFNRVYYDHEKTFSLVTLKSGSNITQLATWICQPDKKPRQTTQATVPTFKIDDNTMIKHGNYTIKKSGFFEHNILFTREGLTLTLCTIAFNNSKKNKEQLEALPASKAVNNRLYDVDKIPLERLINKQLLLLSKEKNNSI